MLKSMTGFGSSQSTFQNINVSVSVKTLNSKQLDFYIKIPSRYRERELQIREIVSKILIRGKIDINIIIEDHNSTDTCINHDLAKKYYNELKILSKNLNIKFPENTLEMILRMPEVVSSSNAQVEEDEWKWLLEIVQISCKKTNEFRINEGKVLKTDIENSISNIEKLIPEIERIDPDRKQQAKERIIKEFQQTQIDISLDESRLEQELFYFLDKIDINEEKVRLSQHLEYFKQNICNNTDYAIGKKLGFIAQEIGREINTLGNKCYNFEIQKRVVMIKDELEKIREQLANIL